MQRRGDVQRLLAAQRDGGGAAPGQGARLHGLQAARDKRLADLRAARDAQEQLLHSPVTLRARGAQGSGSGSGGGAVFSQLYRGAEELQRKKALLVEAAAAEAKQAAMPRINACVSMLPVAQCAPANPARSPCPHAPLPPPHHPALSLLRSRSKAIAESMSDEKLERLYSDRRAAAAPPSAPQARTPAAGATSPQPQPQPSAAFSHQPTIDARSTQLARAWASVPISDRLYALELAKREERARERVLRAREVEKAACPFQPNVAPHALAAAALAAAASATAPGSASAPPPPPRDHAAAAAPAPHNPGALLFARAVDWAAEKTRRLDEARMLAEAKGMENCTFRPVLGGAVPGKGGEGGGRRARRASISGGAPGAPAAAAPGARQRRASLPTSLPQGLASPLAAPVAVDAAAAAFVDRLKLGRALSYSKANPPLPDGSKWTGRATRSVAPKLTLRPPPLRHAPAGSSSSSISSGGPFMGSGLAQSLAAAAARAAAAAGSAHGSSSHAGLAYVSAPSQGGYGSSSSIGSGGGSRAAVSGATLLAQISRGGSPTGAARGEGQQVQQGQQGQRLGGGLPLLAAMFTTDAPVAVSSGSGGAGGGSSAAAAAAAAAPAFALQRMLPSGTAAMASHASYALSASSGGGGGGSGSGDGGLDDPSSVDTNVVVAPTTPQGGWK